MLAPRPLGNTGIDVPPIALGTVKIGRNTGVKYPGSFDLPGDASVTRLLETAAGLGVNLIDTAPAYGTSEERLGRLLPGRREDWLLCTKAGESFENNVSQFDFTADGLTRSVERSLLRLGTDYLDILLIHSDGNDEDILDHSDALETLVRLKHEGKTRLIGMSTKSVTGGLRASEAFDVLMVTLNRQDQSQLPVIARASELGTGILLKKVMASGHDDAAASLEYALSTPGTHSAVIGTLNPDHLSSNVAHIASRLAL